MTHDYIRNGAKTLFAALDVLEGKVIGRCMQARRLSLGRRTPDRHQPLHRDANHQPKPFVWTADPDKIIAAVNREHQVSDSIH